jgi:transglutaminase-like putative cysteine protease
MNHKDLNINILFIDNRLKNLLFRKNKQNTMTRFHFSTFLSVLLIIASPELFCQFSFNFGNITPEELSNKPYKSDLNADAIVLSDIAVAILGYDKFPYVAVERDVRIRIVNSDGFNKANISIPFSADDRLLNYKASTFNTRNGEITETPVQKNSFIIEETTFASRALKFNFPDVHEGSVIEYSYIIRLNRYSVYNLLPWIFQQEIPVAYSSITVKYPDTFEYKHIISGQPAKVNMKSSTSGSTFFGEFVDINILTFSAADVPAFRNEPYILGENEHLTKVSFELAKVTFPNLATMEVTPSYKTLTERLFERSDFGDQLNVNLKSLAEKITRPYTDNLSKFRAIHKYITSNIFWDGQNDYTTSTSLRTILRKEKGNSADINILLIVLSQAAGISAEPVILSTRSNGSLNTASAMVQQFDYVIARISADGELFLADATDPLRPYNQLPFECLNKTGRLISKTGSDFIDLRNNEKFSVSNIIIINPSGDGTLSGKLETTRSGFSAYHIRSLVKLESEAGYLDEIKSSQPNAEIKDFKLTNLNDPDSDLKESLNFVISDGVQVAGDEIIINPFQLGTSITNPFFEAERQFPVDFGCPLINIFEMTMTIPAGYYPATKPGDTTIRLGENGGSFEFRVTDSGKTLKIKSEMHIEKTFFQPSEYKDLQKFYLGIRSKQAEYIILKKK